MHTYTLTLTLTTSMSLADAQEWTAELVAEGREHLLAFEGEAIVVESVR